MAFKCCQSQSCTVCNNISSQTVNIQLRAKLRNLNTKIIIQSNVAQLSLCVKNTSTQICLVNFVLFTKIVRRKIKPCTLFNNANTELWITCSYDFCMYSKSVQQLRTQFTFLWIARSNKNKSRGMTNR